MHTFTELFDLVTGRPIAAEEGHARRLQVGIRAILASIAFAGLFGLAVGSTDLGLALGNLYKVPMVIVLSAICAIPGGLLAWKLTGSHGRASDLLLSLASANFAGTLVLGALAPLVALYYHTSGHMGGVLALIADFLALAVGLVTLVRATVARTSLSGGIAALPAQILPVLVLVGFQFAALLQLVHVASPILPEVAPFDLGVDAVQNIWR
jgi:hypothetical protein